MSMAVKAFSTFKLDFSGWIPSYVHADLKFFFTFN